MGFWKNVGDELEFRGISRKELASKSKVPLTTINLAIERDSKPFAEDAIRIASFLNIPIEQLLEISNKTIVKGTNYNKDFIKCWNKLSKVQKESFVEFLKTITK